MSKLWHPYVGGLALGLTLLAIFFVSGKELGASGTMNRAVALAEHTIAPERTEAHPYFGRFVKGGKNPLMNWLVFLSLGSLLGGYVSGLLAGRNKPEVQRGPRSSIRTRLILAFAGGLLIGFATRFTRGCTSGLALSSCGLLSPGAWIFVFATFGGGFLMAWFVRKQWI